MLRKLYDLNESDGYIPYANGQEINKILASTKVDDLPIEQLNNVGDYIIKALNLGAVSARFIEPLENLLKNIQDKNK